MVQLINKESCHDLLMNNHELHIIDVRSAEDYYAGHLPGPATSILCNMAAIRNFQL